MGSLQRIFNTMKKQHNYTDVCWIPKMKDGVPVRLILEIDRMDLLNQIGGRALHSKCGKAHIGHGAVRVRVAPREDI